MTRKGKESICSKGKETSHKENSNMGVTITLTVSHGLSFLIALMLLLNFLLNPYAIPPVRNSFDESQMMTPSFGRSSMSGGLVSSGGVTSAISGLRFSGEILSDDNRRKLDIIKPRKSKVLMGIVTADVFGEPRYRQAFRDLFVIHPKVCRLADYINLNATQSFKERCELIYTFVLGANVKPDGPTEIVNETYPIITPVEERHPQHSVDFEESDMTFLNIRENMNDGKSQTWFYYGSTVAEKYGFEYVGKMDTDSLPYLDKYFDFSDTSLPPSPYNTRILAGTIVDKRWWPERPEKENDAKEAYFNKRYSTLHLYAAGQMYIMSTDLAKGVGEVCSKMSQMREYLEGHEDHDVSMMAFLALQDRMDYPIKLVIIALDNPWWKHETKLRYGVRKWRKSWDAEIDRMKEEIMGIKSLAKDDELQVANDGSINETYGYTGNDASEPFNAHKDYSLTCDAGQPVERVDLSSVHPATFPLFEMVHGYSATADFNTFGKTKYAGPMEYGVKLLKQQQVCLYSALHRWWELTSELHISRWAAHGDSAMSASCHRSINPWDNSIEITVAKCSDLKRKYSDSADVAAKYPDIDKSQYIKGPWEGRLLDDDWILFKTSRESQINGFKLKSISQIRSNQTDNDSAGLEIMCLDDVSNDEIRMMEKSGYKYHLMGDWPLDVVDFGPTVMQVIPPKINNKYLFERFERPFYCDYPFDDTIPTSVISPSTISAPARASQLENALSHWYIPRSRRQHWLEQVDNVSGRELTKEIPNLDYVEIDNTIADPNHCRTDSDGQDGPLKVIAFNMKHGTYWSEFVRMVRHHWAMHNPDVVILTEMDIGMARSNNVHTARKLAHSLHMNYAWGLEFVELTNGNWEELNMTLGMENALGLTGNAILSNCKLYDPLIIRDTLDDAYFSSKRSYRNGRGSQKRLGGRMGLFARVGTDASVAGNAKHMVLGSVYELHPTAHRDRIWQYLGFGVPVDGILSGTPPDDQISALVAGGFDRKFCVESGLNNLDQPRKHKTWPVDCATESFGKTRGDHFCGNNPSAWEDEAYLPCFKPKGPDGNDDGPIKQLSDHAITQIRLH